MSPPDTQAVILAAGIGSRLGPAADGRPKCLLEVGGRPLLHHHFTALKKVGVKRITVIAGHEVRQVREMVLPSVEVEVNADYDKTNSLYSLWLARHRVDGPLMVINGDVLAHPEVYRSLLEAEGSVLAFDSRADLADEEMKVRFKKGRLEEITKSMDPSAAHGENLGLLKFDAEGARALFDEADRIVSEGRLKEWAPAAVNIMARQVSVGGIDVAGLPWIEIDFPEDLEAARRGVWPAINGQPTPRAGMNPARLSEYASRLLIGKRAC